MSIDNHLITHHTSVRKAQMYKKLHVFLCISFILGACAMTTPVPTPTTVPTSTPMPTPTAIWDRVGWGIAWHDEFDGPELDLKNWTFDIGGNGWGNQEWEVYTDRPENVRIENGMLVIEAREEEATFSGRPYSSARIKTQGLHAWQYGRIEARIKLPYGQGIWPAFWMLGENISTKGWPGSGEIDILEFIGREPDHIHATVHAPGYSGGDGVGSNITVSADSLKNDFHIYAIEWKENEIRWLFDEQEFFKLTPADVPDQWIFDHPFFIILNLAVGGRWPGYPDKTTVFSQFLYVDYVRVYQKP
ncbi:MAG: glycoside hydrolase family 16 protein [Chloroflexota bacterium]|nr:glycoside hydrolase family 16 protein [Chloroflexota bacterium]